MVNQHRSNARCRARRAGRPDGSSKPAQYVARWVEEDTGAHVVELEAVSEQDVRDQLDQFVVNNTLKIERLSP